MFELFAVTAPGVEPVAQSEMRRLGFLVEENPSADHHELGGVAFKGELSEVYRANLHLRTVNRILLRLGHCYATSLGELRKKAGRLNWPRYVSAGQQVQIRVTCHQSRLHHSEAITERLLMAIADRIGAPVALARATDDDADAPPQLIVARFEQNRCTISIDSSGALLHRRGYRLALAKAPLRETFAAALVLASGWDERAPLLDPFCGSGAIPIEAAMLALGIPPGRNRVFAFMSWPAFDRAAWERLMQAPPPVLAAPPPLILASDRDEGAVRMARENAERAGVGHAVNFSCRAVSAIEVPTESGWVVTNPPYGVRVSANRDLRNLYAQFGHVMRSKCPSWQIAMLCADAALLRQTALPLESAMTWSNGGIKVRVARSRRQAASGHRV